MMPKLIDRADTANAIRKPGRAEDFESSDLTSVSVMHELRVKYGVEPGAWEEPSVNTEMAKLVASR